MSGIMHDYVLSGYSGTNQIIRVDRLPRVGVTELVRNRDNTRLYFGGNALNIAVCLARLGLRALPIIRAGSDCEETGLLPMLEQNGVLTEGVSVIEEDVTSICYLVEDDQKEHLTLFYPGAMSAAYAPEDYPDRWFRHARMAVLVVGSRRDNELFLRKAKETGLPVAFGMRADFDAFPEELLWEILTGAHLIFMNQLECTLIREMYGLEEIEELFRQGRAQVIVVTTGSRGSEVYEWDGRKTHVPATQGSRVVDATGAGDSYMAGFLYGYRQGMTPVECAQLGSTMASFIIEEVGCVTNVPTVTELQERNQSRNRREQTR